MRLYDANTDSMRGEFKHGGGAVLDCCFHDESSGFSACADHKVRRYVSTMESLECLATILTWVLSQSA